jgi:hypothetical protein
VIQSVGASELNAAHCDARQFGQRILPSDGRPDDYPVAAVAFGGK